MAMARRLLKAREMPRAAAAFRPGSRICYRSEIKIAAKPAATSDRRNAGGRESRDRFDSPALGR
jgi:hypothetical protein